MTAADCTTLALVAYPRLVWDVAAARHPPGPTYSWQSHLRALCAVARQVHQVQPVELKFAGEAERMYVEALATVSVELLILDIERDRISRPQLPRDALWWANPYDPHLKSRPVKSQSPAGQSRPDAHI
jgi:hypothetical protein